MRTIVMATVTVAALLGAAACSTESGQQTTWQGRDQPVYYDEPPPPMHQFAEQGQPAPAQQQAPAPQQAAAPQRERAAQPSGSHMAFPTGNDSTSVLAIDRLTPAETVAGQPYDYSLRVTNLTDMQLHSVAVRDEIAGNLKINSSTPSAVTPTKPGELTWNLGEMRPHEIKDIRVNATPGAAGTITSCAGVTYQTTLCQTTLVVQPALNVSMFMPKEAGLCDSIPVRVVVTNTGTGPARNVVVRPALPQGFTTADGKAMTELSAGTLAANQSREFNLNLKAPKTGEFTAKAGVAGDMGLTAESSPSAIVIRQPVLAITQTGREKQYLGRPLGYEITVTNTGDWPANDAVIEAAVPAGAAFANASADGGLTTAKDRVTWMLGTLAPKATRTVTVGYTVAEAGTIKSAVSARATCATAVSATTQTAVAGIPAILLEMVDDPDPVELNQSTTYTITVTNQGTAVDTNIKLVCTLDKDSSMEYISSTGATVAKAEGGTITFAPLPSLAPKAKATWKVVVKAMKENDGRFRVEMTSDALTEGAVVKTESTHFYR